VQPLKTLYSTSPLRYSCHSTIKLSSNLSSLLYVAVVAVVIRKHPSIQILLFLIPEQAFSQWPITAVPRLVAMNSRSTIGGSTSYNGYTTHRPAVLGLVKVLLLGLSQIPYASAAPLYSFVGLARREDAPRDAEDPSLWLYLAIAAVLVLLGGAFAGLTIA
jgi:hypothetical protein